MTPQSTAYSIPRNNPLRFLPLVYLLPTEMFAGCPTLRTLSRCFREVLKSETHIATIQSDQFLNEIMITTARLVFPHFGLRGWVEHYTGYSPVWKLANVTHAWAKAVEDESGWGLQMLFSLPRDYHIPFFDADYVKEIMSRAVKRGLTEQGWQPILDVVREMPCEEDFEPWDTNIRKDFLRKWYHTRSKRVQMVSLEACMEDDENGIHEITTDSINIAETVEAEDFCQRFKKRLSEKDMAILELRLGGFTYEEIADKLDYKNHSGVIKRMRAITKIFEQYEAKQ